jgi:tRNA (uracil-5-)-methyltransferase
MVGSPTTGEVRPLPESESILPLGKKPRVDGRKSQKIVSKRAKKRRQKETGLPEPCSADDVLWQDIITVVGKDAVDKASEDEADFDSPFEYHQEVELEIASLGSSGKSCLGTDQGFITMAIWICHPFNTFCDLLTAR